MGATLIVYGIPLVVSLVVHRIIISRLVFRGCTGWRFLFRFAVYGLLCPILLAVGIVAIAATQIGPSMVPWSFFWAVWFGVSTAACILSWILSYGGYLVWSFTR